MTNFKSIQHFCFFVHILSLFDRRMNSNRKGRVKLKQWAVKWNTITTSIKIKFECLEANKSDNNHIQSNYSITRLFDARRDYTIWNMYIVYTQSELTSFDTNSLRDAASTSVAIERFEVIIIKNWWLYVAVTQFEYTDILANHSFSSGPNIQRNFSKLWSVQKGFP